jgi:hypothetical protein
MDQRIIISVKKSTFLSNWALKKLNVRKIKNLKLIKKKKLFAQLNFFTKSS